MRKSQYTDKEYDLMDRLKHENKKLKRELKAARKRLDRYAVAEEKGLIDKDVVDVKRKDKELLELWRCHDCGKGILRLVGPMANRYWRVCDHCQKRTKSQKWTEDVEGVR